MRPHWQQQQEQMRRQQQMAAWRQQQEARARRVNQGRIPQDSARDKFTRVEVEVGKLRQDLAAGRLSEEQFSACLKELAVRDERGTWWMVGRQSGEWYRYESENWVRAQPPCHDPSPTAGGEGTETITATRGRPHRLLGLVVFLSGLAVTLPAGVVAGQVAGFGALLIAWIVGLILTTVVTRKVWRRT